MPPGRLSRRFRVLYLTWDSGILDLRAHGIERSENEVCRGRHSASAPGNQGIKRVAYSGYESTSAWIVR